MQTSMTLPRREFTRAAMVGGTSKLQKDLGRALDRERPFPVNATLYSDGVLDAAMTRLARYQYYVSQYLGEGNEQVIAQREANRTWINWNRRVVKKRARWGAAKGFTFETSPEFSAYANWLLRVWYYNDLVNLLYKTCVTMLVRGDAYWWFYQRTVDRVGRPLPKDQQTVGITLLDSSCVFPVWTESEPSVPSAVLIQLPVQPTPQEQAYLKSILVTTSNIVEYRNEEQTSNKRNPYGVIPMVHMANEAEGVFGTSCLTDLAPLTVAFNAVQQQFHRIIRYCSDPTTVVYGASLKTVEKVADRVWANLPPPSECRVENLEMRAELAPIQQALKELKLTILETGSTPQIAYEASGVSMANASGAAMHLLFQPLLEVTSALQTVLTKAVQRGNDIIAAMFGALETPFNLDSLIAGKNATLDENAISVQWTSCLPTDEGEKLDRVLKLLSARIISRAEAARQVGLTLNQALVGREVLEDSAADLLLAREKSVAVSGGAVNPLVAVAGSIEKQGVDSLQFVLDYCAGLKELSADTEDLAGTAST